MTDATEGTEPLPPIRPDQIEQWLIVREQIAAKWENLTLGQMVDEIARMLTR